MTHRCADLQLFLPGSDILDRRWGHVFGRKGGEFNATQRVAYWEGPPFGGGQWHGEFRGNADQFNRVLEEFAKVDAKMRRLVVHNGIGHSFWLNPNREKDKEAAARIDWVFVVWDLGRWQQLQGLPARFRPRGGNAETGEAPAPQIDVYTGGNIDCRMQLQFVEPQPEGGYKYTTVRNINADENGHWVFTSAPAGWHRIVASADGYVARVVNYGTFDGQPHWSEHNTGLAKPASVSGRVADADGRPLADVDVRIIDVVAVPGGSYDALADYEVKTDRDGRFAVEGLPTGRATVRVHKEGYCQTGLSPEIDTPAEDVALPLVRSASIEVTVDFSDTVRPAGYIVEIEDARGAAVGRWGGSANIDAAGKVRFQNVPPGRYVLTGRPNPGRESQTTVPIPIDLAGGEEWTATLKANPRRPK